MKKKLRRTGIVILIIIFVLLFAVLVLFRNELYSLASLNKIDTYGMFQMTYYGDYGFDDFLKVGAKSDREMERIITKRLLKGMPINFGVTGDGCTAFVTKNEQGEVIYGRNFDFLYSPSLQLFTKPDHGYASVSTVNLSFAGYGEGNLPSGLSFGSFLTLAAPYLPFDGMNEKGVAMALLAVPEADYSRNDNAITLNTTTAIRLVLDKAASVDEAVQMLKGYDIYFSGGINCHFLIADASGKSVIVEYYNGGLQTIIPMEDYQIASNFIAYNGLNIGEGYDELTRHDAVKTAIESNRGFLSNNQAIALLAEVGVINEGTDKLQWSVLYNLNTGEGNIFAHRNIHNIINFHLNLNR